MFWVVIPFLIYFLISYDLYQTLHLDPLVKSSSNERYCLREVIVIITLYHIGNKAKVLPIFTCLLQVYK